MSSRKNHTVCAQEVHDHAVAILQQSLRLVSHGYRCTLETLWLVLFFAASRTTSLFDACQRLRQCPTDQALRNCLLGQLPESGELERRLNLALQADLPPSLRRKSRPMAIDISQIPYYGKPRQQRELRRSKRSRGTSRFHCYATVCVLRRGERFTVAMTYVWKDDSLEQVVRRLVERVKAVGLRPRYVLLDRGFYGLGVVRYLKSVRCPFLMPVVHRGRRPKRPLEKLRGTRRFLAWKRSGFSTHTMDNRQAQTQVRICVAVRSKRDGRGRKSQSLRVMVFAFWGWHPSSASWTAQEYRKRFGIESSYRQMNQCRIRTCSRDAALRLLLVGIALTLRNAWVWFHHRFFNRPRGRGVELHLERLRFRTMMLMLQRCAEATLGCLEVTQTLMASTVAAVPDG
jgi:hypothetical protein